MTQVASVPVHNSRSEGQPGRTAAHTGDQTVAVNYLFDPAANTSAEVTNRGLKENERMLALITESVGQRRVMGHAVKGVQDCGSSQTLLEVAAL